jgi:hypothetical protein
MAKRRTSKRQGRYSRKARPRRAARLVARVERAPVRRAEYVPISSRVLLEMVSRKPRDSRGPRPQLVLPASRRENARAFQIWNRPGRREVAPLAEKDPIRVTRGAVRRGERPTRVRHPVCNRRADRRAAILKSGYGGRNGATVYKRRPGHEVHC